MSETSAFVDAPPERVWAVLADAAKYEDWVVGSREVRRWDPEWPEPGATLHHTVAAGPVVVRDTTTVLEADPPRRLLLRARARPAGVAHVGLDLRPEGDGTRVVLSETLVDGPPARLDNPLQRWVLRRRNDESLRRLKRLAEPS